MPLAIDEPAEPERICTKHGCALVVTTDDSLRCPKAQHPIHTWLVILRGELYAEGSVALPLPRRRAR